MQAKKRLITFRTVLIFVIILILGIFALLRLGEYESKPDNRTPLAECLTKKGVKMYGAYWCPHCSAQKKLFGTAFSKVTYVECAIPGDPQQQTQACKDEKIAGYPTWIFPDDIRVSGEQTLENLAKKVDCPWSGKVE